MTSIVDLGERLSLISAPASQIMYVYIDFGISGGLAVPVAQFNAISVAPSLEPVPSGSNPRRFQGFLKNEGGQAELGYSLGFHLTYHLTSSVFLSLNYLKI